MKEIDIKINSMSLDIDPSAVQGTMAYENMNLRFSPTDDGNSIMSITNEKGTLALGSGKEVVDDKGNPSLQPISIAGHPIGYAIVLNYLVLFSTNQSLSISPDYITILELLHGSFLGIVATCKGNFNFSENTPIETLASIEREDLLKVYWIDGVNPLRMLIVNDIIKNSGVLLDAEYFNAVKKFTPPKVTITKNNSGGVFPSGTIQYACTYSSKYKGESNICYLSPLQYLSYKNGIAADKTCNCSFNCSISNVDGNYDYINLYSIVRTGINATPQVKLVTSISTKEIRDYQTTEGKYEVQHSDEIYNSGEINYRDYTTGTGRTAKSISYRLRVHKKTGDTTSDIIYTFNSSTSSWDYKNEGGDNVTLSVKLWKYTDNTPESPIVTYPEFVVKPEHTINIAQTRSQLVFYYTVLDKYTTKESTLGEYTYADTGLNGSEEEPLKLLFVGGENYIPKCIAQKDDTLFLGNITLSRTENLPQITKDTDCTFEFTQSNNLKQIKASDKDFVYYSHDGQLQNSADKITTFKAGEYYRIGILFLDVYGRWTNPLYIGDYKQGLYPGFKEITSSGKSYDSILSYGKLLLKKSYVNSIVDLGYVKVRPLIVYPNAYEREVLFQGVANCTILKGKATNGGAYAAYASACLDDSFTSEYSIPSWFFRPKAKDLTWQNDGSVTPEYATYGDKFHIGKAFEGVPLQYLHNFLVPLYNNNNNDDEIWSLQTHYQDMLSTRAEFLYKTDADFRIDWKTITVDSPDIKFNEQLANTDFTNCKVRIVGYAEPKAFVGSYFFNADGVCEILANTITSEKLVEDSSKQVSLFGNGLKFDESYISRWLTKNSTTSYADYYYGGTLINYPLWVDAFSCKKVTSDGKVEYYDWYKNCFANWYVFPWNRSDAMNNCPSASRGNLSKWPEQLKLKVLATSKFTANTKYFDSTSTSSWNISNKQDAKIFLSDNALLTTRFNDGTIYRNSIDVILPASGYPPYARIYKNYYYKGSNEGAANEPYSLGGTASRSIYPIDSGRILNWMYDSSTSLKYYDCATDKVAGNLSSNYFDEMLCNSPIPMSFKTGSNCVIKLDGDDDLLTRFGSNHYGFPIVEVYRENLNRFGGTIDTALQNNSWTIAGEEVYLSSIGEGDDATLKVLYTLGDTYYLRYDCLKTVPYSDTSVNGIVEILSFMCETHVNIDGRYDSNRGLVDNTTVNNENFNLLNDVYSLLDNYFTYNIQDKESLSVNNYPTLIVWPLTKINGALIDKWLSNTLTSYVNLDGDKGSVNAIKFFKNNLFVFQDKGISLLKYNLNVLLNSTAGVPIEIANSQKVTGFQYIETASGCADKWAIAETPDYLAYIDHYNKSLNLLSELGRTDISSNFGMYSWFRNNIYPNAKWDTLYQSLSTRLLYSTKNNELLVTNIDDSLAYNLTNKAFTSFYSYNGVPWLVNFNGTEMFINSYTKESTFSDATTQANVTTLSLDADSIGSAGFDKLPSTYVTFWALNLGDYNSFFGENKPYYTRFIANDALNFDYMKLFSTLEIRDNITTDLQDGKPLNQAFSTIQVRDSYLDSGVINLDYRKNRPSILKSKFRVWRIDIPRDNIKKRDRMTDHYLDVELVYNPTKLDKEWNTERTRIHDMKLLYL